MNIVADDREENAGVVESLREMKDVHVEIRRLRIGDYLVAGRVLFERKTLADFAVSLIDGRLFRQSAWLAYQILPAVYIVEGEACDAMRCGVSREAIQGALVTLSVIYGFPVIRTTDPKESARLISYACDQIDRARREAIARPGYRPKGKRKRQLFILQGLPQVGPVRARLLLDAFGSVRGVFLAGQDELRRLKGIGEGTAEAIEWAVSEG
ncbi:MAG: nuclease [Candidatus Eisenbacteria bacterium]|nr:nuclease [Candidatus Eisenbacteria bacterium]